MHTSGSCEPPPQLSSISVCFFSRSFMAGSCSPCIGIVPCNCGSTSDSNNISSSSCSIQINKERVRTSIRRRRTTTAHPNLPTLAARTVRIHTFLWSRVECISTTLQTLNDRILPGAAGLVFLGRVEAVGAVAARTTQRARLKASTVQS